MMSRLFSTRPGVFKANPTKIRAQVHTWIKPEGYDTGIKVYNCVAKSTVPVIIRNKNYATWYTCGPTVYDPSHIGHASCYIKLDIIQRILKDYFNINLVTAMNITDIDDKIINKGNQTAISWKEVAASNEASFWSDLKRLKVKEPDIRLRVTSHIPDIVEYIKKIIEKDMAYVGKDNSVYFKVNKYPSYGKLQKIILEENEHNLKENSHDFALWKSSKPNEPAWESPWGPGRPGWHIECSTVAGKVFGDSIDFHAGGLDLRFPHHENEEAQSCVYYDKKQWINYWLHTGQLSCKDQTEKMSKSLNNTISIADYLEDNTSDDFRMACLLSNYKSSMEYSPEMLCAARSTLHKLTSFLSDCRAYADGKKKHVDFDSVEICQKISESRQRIDDAFRNDFDTAKAVGHLMHLSSAVSKAINTTENNASDRYCSSNTSSIVAAANFCSEILSVFGIDAEERSIEGLCSESLDIRSILDNIIVLRSTLRERGKKNKDKNLLQISDEIREILKVHGIEIKDHALESSWNVVEKSKKKL